MRALGLAVLLPILVACSSTPPPAPADEAWSAWSAPERGLTCRARVPARVLRGALVPVVLALRTDPDSVPAGMTHFDGFHPGQRTRLVFRPGNTGATVDVRLDEEEYVRETFAEGEEPDPLESPENLPLLENRSKEWPMGFPISTAWDALVPGTWEVRIVMETAPSDGGAGAWAGSISTPPISLIIEETPLGRMEVRIPRAIHLRATSSSHGGIEAFWGPEDSETVVIEARTGFLLGMAWRERDGASVEIWGDDVDGASFSFTTHPAPDGSIDQTHEVEIFECGREPYSVHHHRPGHAAYRTLWKRSYRVAFSAAEIEALRR